MARGMIGIDVAANDMLTARQLVVTSTACCFTTNIDMYGRLFYSQYTSTKGCIGTLFYSQYIDMYRRLFYIYPIFDMYGRHMYGRLFYRKYCSDPLSYSKLTFI